MGDRNQRKEISAIGKEEAQQGSEQRGKVAPIVAIGASAGGVEALQEFFAHMPSDSGISFVIVTHTSPERESLLPEIIANVTDMPAVACRDGSRLEPNRIVVAKDSILKIENGLLHHVTAEDSIETTHRPVDYLFRALASDQGARAICIVLSGTGNDGTLGVREIKAAGGMAMIQDPETTRYSGMPESAQATGLVDYVLPPRDLPAALVEYCRGPYLAIAQRRESAYLSDESMRAILIRMRARTGHDFTFYKKSTMSRRIERRMNVHNIEEPETYLRYVRENPAELDLLLRELLISVTSFFRDPEAFRALEEKGISRLLDERDESHTFRVWVPGCATGEEAYSVAILLEEQIRKSDGMQDVLVFATDLDPDAIEVARAGLYPKGIAADVPKGRLKRYFSREDESYRIHKSIREKIIFSVQNVLSDPPFMRLDLVVCRNLLIYLNNEAQRRLLPRFHFALLPGGLLFLGSSETITGSEELYEVLDGKYKIMRRKETSKSTYADMPPIGTPVRSREEKERSHSPGDTDRPLARTIERLLLEQFAPCSAVVDQRNIVSYLHGRSGSYFEPEQGEPRNNILEMAREGLKAPLTRCLREARKTEGEVKLRGVRVRTDGGPISVSVQAKPLNKRPSLQGLMLVTIQPEEPGSEEPSDRAAVPQERYSEDADLELELQHAREDLQLTIEELETSNEELKSSNEELQATNEELQSSNEELETSKEEMHSLNEELSTVNAELKSKVEALSRSHDDMNNLLNSMQVATIFLDDQLRVKRYTRKAEEVVRLIDSDIGRPLADLTSSLEYPELIEDCREVLATLAAKESEVVDEQGRAFLVRILPYRTSENVIDGVVLTMVDIDRLKQAELEASAREFFESIVETVRQPLVVLDHEFRVVSANSAFYGTFDAEPKKTEGRQIYELQRGAWDIPGLRDLLEDVLPERSVLSDYRVEHEFLGTGRREFLLNARKLRRRPEKPAMILLVFEEITRKES